MKKTIQEVGMLANNVTASYKSASEMKMTHNRRGRNDEDNRCTK